ncbi:hypothetical protein H5410_023267 [Solanum commersonii]|uniref:Uncharacterized protein n=1 Tax=Solanum commersonii TaxID=4109 RepID=A0A9J5ZH27_SOLCO|nr:hypothetical protein H5410_023267 [Solanum commersonii]
MKHVLLTFGLTGSCQDHRERLCVPEFLESWEVRCKIRSLVPNRFSGAYGRRGTKDVLMAPQLPSLPLKLDV